MEEATVEYDVGFVTIDMPFNQEVIDRLKEEIPPDERHWDDGRKVWAVNDRYWITARAIIEEFFVITE